MRTVQLANNSLVCLSSDGSFSTDDPIAFAKPHFTTVPKRRKEEDIPAVEKPRPSRPRSVAKPKPEEPEEPKMYTDDIFDIFKAKKSYYSDEIESLDWEEYLERVKGQVDKWPPTERNHFTELLIDKIVAEIKYNEPKSDLERLRLYHKIKEKLNTKYFCYFTSTDNKLNESKYPTDIFEAIGMGVCRHKAAFDLQVLTALGIDCQYIGVRGLSEREQNSRSFSFRDENPHHAMIFCPKLDCGIDEETGESVIAENVYIDNSGRILYSDEDAYLKTGMDALPDYRLLHGFRKLIIDNNGDFVSHVDIDERILLSSKPFLLVPGPDLKTDNPEFDEREYRNLQVEIMKKIPELVEIIESGNWTYSVEGIIRSIDFDPETYDIVGISIAQQNDVGETVVDDLIWLDKTKTWELSTRTVSKDGQAREIFEVLWDENATRLTEINRFGDETETTKYRDENGRELKRIVVHSARDGIDPSAKAANKKGAFAKDVMDEDDKKPGEQKVVIGAMPPVGTIHTQKSTMYAYNYDDAGAISSIDFLEINEAGEVSKGTKKPITAKDHDANSFAPYITTEIGRSGEVTLTTLHFGIKDYQLGPNGVVIINGEAYSHDKKRWLEIGDREYYNHGTPPKKENAFTIDAHGNKTLIDNDDGKVFVIGNDGTVRVFTEGTSTLVEEVPIVTKHYMEDTNTYRYTVKVDGREFDVPDELTLKAILRQMQLKNDAKEATFEEISHAVQYVVDPQGKMIEVHRPNVDLEMIIEPSEDGLFGKAAIDRHEVGKEGEYITRTFEEHQKCIIETALDGDAPSITVLNSFKTTKKYGDFEPTQGIKISSVNGDFVIEVTGEKAGADNKRINGATRYTLRQDGSWTIQRQFEFEQNFYNQHHKDQKPPFTVELEETSDGMASATTFIADKSMTVEEARNLWAYNVPEQNRSPIVDAMRKTVNMLSRMPENPMHGMARKIHNDIEYALRQLKKAEGSEPWFDNIRNEIWRIINEPDNREDLPSRMERMNKSLHDLLGQVENVAKLFSKSKDMRNKLYDILTPLYYAGDESSFTDCLRDGICNLDNGEVIVESELDAVRKSISAAIEKLESKELPSSDMVYAIGNNESWLRVQTIRWIDSMRYKTIDNLRELKDADGNPVLTDDMRDTLSEIENAERLSALLDRMDESTDHIVGDLKDAIELLPWSEEIRENVSCILRKLIDREGHSFSTGEISVTIDDTIKSMEGIEDTEGLSTLVDKMFKDLRKIIDSKRVSHRIVAMRKDLFNTLVELYDVKNQSPVTDDMHEEIVKVLKGLKDTEKLQTIIDEVHKSFRHTLTRLGDTESLSPSVVDLKKMLRSLENLESLSYMIKDKREPFHNALYRLADTEELPPAIVEKCKSLRNLERDQSILDEITDMIKTVKKTIEDLEFMKTLPPTDAEGKNARWNEMQIPDEAFSAMSREITDMRKVVERIFGNDMTWVEKVESLQTFAMSMHGHTTSGIAKATEPISEYYATAMSLRPQAITKVEAAETLLHEVQLAPDMQLAGPEPHLVPGEALRKVLDALSASFLGKKAGSGPVFKRH